MLYNSLCSQDIQVFTLTLKYVHAIGWAVPENNQTEQNEDMEFSRVMKKQQMNFPGVN